MAALSADTARKYEDGLYGSLPVKASSTIYRGDAVGLVSGYARQLVAGDIFGGFASAKAVGTGSDGGANVSIVTGKRIELAISGAAVTDIGKSVYASDSDTFTLTQSTNSRVGTVARFVSTGVVIVEFDAFRTFGLTSVVVLTDSSGGAAANDTIGAVTAPTTLTDNGAGTGTSTIGAMTDIATAGGATPSATQVDTAVNAALLAIRNNFKVYTTSQALNRTAIIALTDAVKELSTKINEMIASQR